MSMSMRLWAMNRQSVSECGECVCGGWVGAWSFLPQILLHLALELANLLIEVLCQRLLVGEHHIDVTNRVKVHIVKRIARVKNLRHAGKR